MKTNRPTLIRGWAAALLLAVALLLPQTAAAYDFMVGGLCYNKNSDGTSVTVTYQKSSSPRYTDLSGDLVIPESVTYSGTTYSVTAIGSGAFDGCSGLSSVTIGNSVTTIGSTAFSGCSGLTSVTWNAKNCADFSSSSPFSSAKTTITSFTFGEQVEKIPAYLCYQMTGLTSVTIGNSVTSIGGSAFSGCSGLTSVSIGNSVTSLGSDAFRGCSGLASVTIPYSVTSISGYAFSGCSGLTSVTWNAKNCADPMTAPFSSAKTSITSFTFGEQVEKIPAYLCNGLTGLTSVTIPNSVTSIGGSAFYGCSGLTSVTIPNSVTSIGNYAFRGCSGLISVTIGNSVTSIGSSAFYGCSGLTSVTIGNSVTSIGGSAFEGCSGPTSVTWNAKNCADFSSSSPFSSAKTSIKSFTFGDEVEKIPAYLCYQMTGLVSVTIPNSVTSIGGSAFSGCSGLTSVTIPNSVTSIGGSAFRDCSGLTSVTWNAKNCSNFTSSTFSSAKTSIKSFTIGEQVQRIPAYLCYQMTGLTSVTIPNSVTSIGDDAFLGCSGLTSVSIGNSVTSIGQSAFRVCSGLTSVTIPNSVTSIGDWAFCGCSGLISVTIGNSVTYIGQSAFYNCSGLTSVTIPNSVTSIGGSSFYGCSGLTSVTIGNSVTSIGRSAFYNCSGLKNLVLGKSISEFCSEYDYYQGRNENMSETFRGCKSLSKITSYATIPGKFTGILGFDNVPTSCILYVPKGTVEAYWKASPWSRFTNILEMESLVATAGEVTVSRPGELVEVPITLTMPDGCTLNDITIDLTYPDGLLPLADEQGRYGAAGDGINVANGAPVMTFVDNFSSDDAWPDYQVTGDAAQAVQANAGNPTAVYSLHVTGDPFYTAGNRDLKIHVRYTDIDGDEYEAGTAEEFELLTTVHFVRDYDINGDGIVDINDVSIMINLIMGRTTNFAGRADLTGDGRISVSDLNMVIDAMLGKY